ncbi:ataxin-1-like [Haliotis rufescens]|uniref:ataxin-1-like n=1 Tax=Haliotis rufescens TaxID=6454 RepID=UPI001EB0A810|nr:ataxin-1-like [Haliotis rufescens]
MSSSRSAGSRESPCASSSGSVLVPPYDSAVKHRLAVHLSGGSFQTTAPAVPPGPDGQSLLCSESLSSTPPSDDTQRLSQDRDPSAWKKSDLLKNRKVPLQYALIVSNDHPSGGQHKALGNNVHPQHIQLIADKENNIDSGVVDGLPHNNEAHADNRMNSNGFERARMTGGTPSTNENLVWLADVAVSQNQAQSRPAEGMISGRSSQNQGQGQTQESQQTMLSAGASVGSVFRPSLTEPSQRLLAGGQYMSGGGSASSLGQYSPLYSVHGQPSHLTASVPQFSAFYHQYPQSYPHGSAALIAGGHYPHIESYSAVLASMGSHVQHGGHSQLPRSPYMPSGHIPQYSVLGSHRTMPSASSPGPNATHHQQSAHPAGTVSLSGGESLVSPKLESQEGEGRCHRSGSTSSLRDEKGSNLSPNTGHSSVKGLNVRESPKGFLDKDFYKVPSGKEGSLKHRILTRPQDSQLEGSHIDDSKYALPGKHDEPLLKRTKFSSYSGMPSSHSSAAHSRGQSESVSHGLGPGPPNTARVSPSPQTSYPPSHLHYPPHFMKGSIIQLANGELKRVEDLQTDDFVVSADISSDLKIDSSTVVRIQEQPERGTAILGFSVGEHRVQVTVEATMEHPFFVFGRGWSSCSAERTLHRYGLECHKLSVGDVCISLTHKDVPLKAAEISQQQSQSEARERESPPEEKAHQGQGHQGHTVTFSDTVTTTHLHSSRSPSHQATCQSSESEGDSHLPRKRRWSAPDQVSVDSESEQERSEDTKPESIDQ